MSALKDFFRFDSQNLFEKCEKFSAFTATMHPIVAYQYRTELQGALDHRITVTHPFEARNQELICFDSNSYLGLHMHPRVISVVEKTLRVTGYGTPSAQLLSGNNRWLRELEDTIAAFHGRSAAMVFPSGYAGAVGVVTGLLRECDAVAWDDLSHASLQDGCAWSSAGTKLRYPNMDLAALDTELQAAKGLGKLVVSDGVFSMHGSIADLPALKQISVKYGAKLLIDEAHSLGILGATGRGLEELHNAPGSIDILLGTFSKATGSVGGYVCASKEVIEYLRYYARPGVFTASLPAPTCAGISESIRLMDAEPAHRETLWANTRRLWQGLSDVGFQLAPMQTPIISLPVGEEGDLFACTRTLFESGVRCGCVTFPAVRKGEAALRITANARHTSDEIDHAIEAIFSAGKQHGFKSLKASLS